MGKTYKKNSEYSEKSKTCRRHMIDDEIASVPEKELLREDEFTEDEEIDWCEQCDRKGYYIDYEMEDINRPIKVVCECCQGFGRIN